MSNETVIAQCAPTLAGIKTGNLFTCPCEDKDELLDEIRAFNKRFASKGLRLLPMKFEKNRVLLYMFRPKGLRKDLQDSLARKVLEQEGYPWSNAGKCVGTLVRKLREEEGFPHEIGLFLSYPPEDVKGFIDNQACNYKYSGIWKVYGDVEKAQEMFSKYKNCTRAYRSMYDAGADLEQLAVEQD